MANLASLEAAKAWLGLGQVQESAEVPAAAGPYVITAARAAAWTGDAGVLFTDTGELATPVAADPDAGEYAVAAGVYTFAAADAERPVQIAYVTATAEDALLARLLGAASGFIEAFIQRRLTSQEYQEVRDGKGGRRLPFANYPVTAVSRVQVDGVEIPAAASITEPGWRFTPSLLHLAGYAFTPGDGNVEIAYTAGYAAIPPEIEQACLELVALRYKERDHIGQVSKDLGGQTVSFWTKDAPESVKTVLQQYRKVVPL